MINMFSRFGVILLEFHGCSNDNQHRLYALYVFPYIDTFCGIQVLTVIWQWTCDMHARRLCMFRSRSVLKSWCVLRNWSVASAERRIAGAKQRLIFKQSTTICSATCWFQPESLLISARLPQRSARNAPLHGSDYARYRRALEQKFMQVFKGSLRDKRMCL